MVGSVWVWAGGHVLVRMRWNERRRKASFLVCARALRSASYLGGLAWASRGSPVMASWVFCNLCFQPPHRKSSFSLTSCGHVYCDSCLRKGPLKQARVAGFPLTGQGRGLCSSRTTEPPLGSLAGTAENQLLLT